MRTIKQLTQISPTDFRRASRICFGPAVCGRWCDKGTWAHEFNKAWGDLIDIMIPSGAVAKTRFLSWSTLLAMAHWTVMVAEIGPHAWLMDEAGWSVAKVDEALENNIRNEPKDDVEQFRKDMSVRLHCVSTYLSKIPNRVFITIANPSLMPADKMFRYLDRCNAVANRHKAYHPLVLEVVQPDWRKNPLKIFLREQAALLRADGDVCWVLQRWFRALDSVPTTTTFSTLYH